MSDYSEDFDDINSFLRGLPDEMITALCQGKISFEVSFEYLETDSEYCLKPRIKITSNSAEVTRIVHVGK